MKLLFTEGVGAVQTTTNAQDEKIKVFASEEDMLDNIDTLQENEIVATNDATEADLISSILTKVVPTGTILPGMWQQAPTGFLLCDGSEYLKTQYPDLARVLSSVVGTEGSTEYTFKVPNLRDRFLEGGTNIGEYKEAGLPNIEGSWNASYKYDTYLEGEATGAFSIDSSGTTTAKQHGNIDGNTARNIFKLDASLSNEIYGSSDTVQPASYTVNYIIKY